MTGPGFGGSIVALVPSERARALHRRDRRGIQRFRQGPGRRCRGRRPRTLDAQPVAACAYTVTSSIPAVSQNAASRAPDARDSAPGDAGCYARSQPSAHSSTPVAGRKKPYGISSPGSSSLSRISPSDTTSRKRSSGSASQRGERARPDLVLEEERRRILEPADPEASLDQAYRLVPARERPVSLSHVAHQERVAREVHRVHLGELGRRRTSSAPQHIREAVIESPSAAYPYPLAIRL